MKNDHLTSHLSFSLFCNMTAAVVRLCCYPSVCQLFDAGREERTKPAHNMPSRLDIFPRVSFFFFIDISIFGYLLIFSDIWRLLSFSTPESGQEVDRAGHSPQRITQQRPGGMCHLSSVYFIFLLCPTIQSFPLLFLPLH